MHILLSNDDGIEAPGILALYEALKDLGRITVAAPVGQQSGVGQALTLGAPIEATAYQHPAGFSGWAIRGTPTDCVKLAVTTLMEDRPDLVISGVNHGPNMGISILYSGTVAAATEGAIQGIPSMAVSIDTFEAAHWNTAAAAAKKVAPLLHQHGLPPDTLLNLNVPNTPEEEIQGFKVTRIGRSRFVDEFKPLGEKEGTHSYWVQGYMKNLDEGGGTDIDAVESGFISMTPLSLYATQTEALHELERWGLT